MSILTSKERAFRDVFLHEVTTPPFTGPATRALHQFGLEYGDLSYIVWAYEQDVPRTGFEVGHTAEHAPPIPWESRASALRRNQDIQLIWEQERKPVSTPKDD